MKSEQKNAYYFIFDISSLVENLYELQMRLYAYYPVKDLRGLVETIIRNYEQETGKNVKRKYTLEELLQGNIIMRIKGYVYDSNDNIKTDRAGNPIIREWQYYEMENRIQIIHGTNNIKMQVINLGDKRPNLNALMKIRIGNEIWNYIEPDLDKIADWSTHPNKDYDKYKVELRLEKFDPDIAALNKRIKELNEAAEKESEKNAGETHTRILNVKSKVKCKNCGKSLPRNSINILKEKTRVYCPHCGRLVQLKIEGESKKKMPKKKK